MTAPADILRAAEAQAAELAGLALIGKRDAKIRELKRLLGASQDHAAALEQVIRVKDALAEHSLAPLKIRKGKRTKGRDPHTAVALVSDWHSTEIVDPDEVNGLNRHNPDIGLERAEKYARDLSAEVKRFQDRAHLEALVLALLGDFLTGEIHGVESARSCDMTPIEEVVFIRPMLTGLIDHLLSELDVPLRIPCVWGNHGRTTDKPRHRRDAGYSYEQLIYTDLAATYRDNPRVKFDISTSAHKVVDAGGFRMLFTHGDKGLRYGGGIGGLAVPFNRIFRQAWAPTFDVDLANVGHFHTRNSFRVGFTNGSLVGPNVYAKNMGLPLERPSQWLYLVDHERQDVGTAAPIWVD